MCASISVSTLDVYLLLIKKTAVTLKKKTNSFNDILYTCVLISGFSFFPCQEACGSGAHEMQDLREQEQGEVTPSLFETWAYFPGATRACSPAPRCLPNGLLASF